MMGRGALYRVDAEQEWELDGNEVSLRFEECRKPLREYVGKVVRLSVKSDVHSLDAAALLTQITHSSEINPQRTYWLYTFQVVEAFSYEYNRGSITITNKGDSK